LLVAIELRTGAGLDVVARSNMARKDKAVHVCCTETDIVDISSANTVLKRYYRVHSHLFSSLTCLLRHPVALGTEIFPLSMPMNRSFSSWDVDVQLAAVCCDTVGPDFRRSQGERCQWLKKLFSFWLL